MGEESKYGMGCMLCILAKAFVMSWEDCGWDGGGGREGYIFGNGGVVGGRMRKGGL